MKKRVWIAVVILLIINLAAGGFVWYTIGKTHSSITVEAGSVVTAEHFIKREVEEIFFAEDCPAFDTTVPGTYELRITADGFTRSCLLHVEDTVAPKAEPRHPQSETTGKFSNLQFGRNYDPTKR